MAQYHFFFIVNVIIILVSTSETHNSAKESTYSMMVIIPLYLKQNHKFSHKIGDKFICITLPIFN